jgi:cobalamin biosynthesis protein CobT
MKSDQKDNQSETTEATESNKEIFGEQENAEEDAAPAEEKFDHKPYLEELNHELLKIASDEVEIQMSAQLILQAYSMKPMEELTETLSPDKKHENLDEEGQNLVYFYHLIKQFFDEHFKEERLSKNKLRELIETN